MMGREFCSQNDNEVCEAAFTKLHERIAKLEAELAKAKTPAPLDAEVEEILGQLSRYARHGSITGGWWAEAEPIIRAAFANRVEVPTAIINFMRMENEVEYYPQFVLDWLDAQTKGGG